MRILIACEESQSVCKEFRNRGHDAFSCDIMEESGGHPEWHIQGDVIEQLDKGWDMMIAFPPCTHLAVSGARHFKEKIKDGRQQKGIDFFMDIINAPIDKIAVENPIGIMSNEYKKPSQIIQPYYFGDEFQKTTCLWLKNLPLLYHNDKPNLFDANTTHVGKGEFVTFKSGKRMAKWYADLGWNAGHMKSKTFPGIAKAMAEQWSKKLIE
jgi:site-specific DNA-cytosine methylase